MGKPFFIAAVCSLLCLSAAPPLWAADAPTPAQKPPTAPVKLEGGKWFEDQMKMAQAGDERAMLTVGTAYLAEGKCEQAAEWLKRSADKGETRSMLFLGMLSAKGAGVPKDMQVAAQWYRKSAELGNVDGMVLLSGCLWAGTGIARDQKQAVEWATKAAEQGEPTAMQLMGTLCIQGVGGVMKKNPQKAKEWFLKAAEKGDAKAMCCLGTMHAQGDGIPQDFKQGADWYQKAVDKGDTDAMCGLGELYVAGHGVPKNRGYGYFLCNMAAERGNANAIELCAKLKETLTPAELAESEEVFRRWKERQKKQGPPSP